MSQAYRLTERAEADLEAIADFIAADSLEAAVKVVLALEDAFVLLASRPGIGHTREDLSERPLKCRFRASPRNDNLDQGSCISS